jgi:hypothetical protein
MGWTTSGGSHAAIAVKNIVRTARMVRERHVHIPASLLAQDGHAAGTPQLKEDAISMR